MTQLDLGSCRVHDLTGYWVLSGVDLYGSGVLPVQDPKGFWIMHSRGPRGMVGLVECRT